MINAKMKTGSTVYCGPSSSIYASVGSVDAGADVVLICRDPIDSNYVYAGYAINVGEAADAKRGYIPVSAVNVSVTDVNKLPARLANGKACRCTSKLTVINKPVGGSASVGSISANESFTRFDETDNAYTYVEYSTSSKTKRGFVLTSSLSSGSNTGRTGVVAESCDVYHGPDLDGYAKVGSVDAGEVVAVLEYETPISADKWLMIEYNTTSGRKRGYVPRHYISITSFSGVNVMRKIQSIATFAGTASAKAYYGPNTTFPSVGSIGAGELVSIIDQWDTNGSYRFIEYNTSGGKKRGYVAGTFSNATGFDHRAAMNYDVYHGPDASNYAKVGSVDQGDPVKIIWQEGDWFYIQYPAKSNLKAGFVPKTVIKDYAGISTDTHSYAGYMQQVNAGSQAVDVKAGPDASFAKVGTVSPTEGVTVFNYTKDGYTYIEYATSKGTKRGYIPTSSLNPETVQGKLAYVSDAKAGAYVGTDTTYFKAGGVYQGEFVVVLAEDKETIYQTKWSYIEYNSSAGRKRGYVDKTSITLLPYTGQIPATVRSRLKMCAVVNDGNVMYGPGSYAKVGTVSAGERVIVLQEDGPSQYSYIEYSTGKTASKRGYVPNSNLTDVSVSFKTVPAPGNAALKREYSDGVSPETLEYYQFGGGPNVLIAYFAEHGFEDAWAADGWELAQIGCGVFDRLYSQKDNLSGWTVYVIPCLNRKGVLNGWTNNGPGRTAVDSGVDINRWFPTNNFKYYSDARNWNRASVREGNLLKSFITSKKSSSSVTIALDVHGWLGYSIGDAEIGKSFIDQFNFYNKSLANGSGYSAKWCQEQGIKASLIELPLPANPAAIISGNYAGKVADAIVDVMGKSWSGSVSTTSYSLGAEGSMVELFQAYLKYNGYYSLLVDGKFGKSTYDAVKRYQTDHNIEADGIIGSETWVVMGFLTAADGEVDRTTTVYTTYRKYADYYTALTDSYRGMGSFINIYLRFNSKNMAVNNNNLIFTSDLGAYDPDAYRFQLVFSQMGYYIQSEKTGQVLTLNASSGNITLSDKYGTLNYAQLWSFQYADGYAVFRNITSNEKTLSVVNDVLKWENTSISPYMNKVVESNKLTAEMKAAGVSLYFRFVNKEYYFDITAVTKLFLDSYLDHGKIYTTEEEYEGLYNPGQTFADMNAGVILDFFQKAGYERAWDLEVWNIWKNTNYLKTLPFALEVFQNRNRLIDKKINFYLKWFSIGYLGRSYGFGETCLRWLCGIIKSARAAMQSDYAANNGILAHDYIWYLKNAMDVIGFGPFPDNATMGVTDEEFEIIYDGVKAYVQDDNSVAVKVDGAVYKEIMLRVFGLNWGTSSGNMVLVEEPIFESDIKALKIAGKEAVARNLDFLTGTALSPSETELIVTNGLKLIPIFEHGYYGESAYTFDLGKEDAENVKQLVKYLRIPEGTRIYFRYEFSPSHIATQGIEYIRGINSVFKDIPYQAGVYGSQSTCIAVAQIYSDMLFFMISEGMDMLPPGVAFTRYNLISIFGERTLYGYDVSGDPAQLMSSLQPIKYDWVEIETMEGEEYHIYTTAKEMVNALRIGQMILALPPLNWEMTLFDLGCFKLSYKIYKTASLTDDVGGIDFSDGKFSPQLSLEVGDWTASVIGMPLTLNGLEQIAFSLGKGRFQIQFEKSGEEVTIVLTTTLQKLKVDTGLKSDLSINVDLRFTFRNCNKGNVQFAETYEALKKAFLYQESYLTPEDVKAIATFAEILVAGLVIGTIAGTGYVLFTTGATLKVIAALAPLI